MAAAVGTGAAITFDTGFFAEIMGINWSGIERPSIDQTHMGTTTARSFFPGDLFDPGELEVEIHFATGTRPPIDDAAETLTLTFGDSNTWAASGFMTGFEFGVPLEDKMTGTARIKFSGDITLA